MHISAFNLSLDIFLMHPLDEFLLALRPHELELLAAFILIQRVDEQVELVDVVLDLLDELADIRDELGRVHVVQQVYVDLVLAQQAKGQTVALSFDVPDDLLQHQDARVYPLEVAPRHLQDRLSPVHRHQPGTSLHRSHVEVRIIL